MEKRVSGVAGIRPATPPESNVSTFSDTPPHVFLEKKRIRVLAEGGRAF
jgi:hypothetical protein